MFSNGTSDTAREDARSVYGRVLGPDFENLDPRLRRYFGYVPVGDEGVGEGVFASAGLRCRPLRPAFAILARLGIAFPERESDVRFEVRNVPLTDGSLRGIRRFHFGRVTRTMVDRMDAVDGRFIDRLGARQLLEVALDLRVVEGRLHMRSRRLSLRLGRLRVPLPHLARVELVEEAVDEGQRVSARIVMPWIGEVYGYSGTFTYAVRPRQCAASYASSTAAGTRPRSDSV